MNSLLDKLPTILVLFVLVGIFLSLRKHAPSARIRLWTYAWALIFLHFFIQAFETHTGTLENILESIDIGSLELSGVVFVVSMTLAVEDRRKRLMMLAVLAVPTAFHAVAAVFDWHVYGLMTLALGNDFLRRRGFRAAQLSAHQTLRHRHRHHFGDHRNLDDARPASRQRRSGHQRDPDAHLRPLRHPLLETLSAAFAGRDQRHRRICGLGRGVSGRRAAGALCAEAAGESRTLERAEILRRVRDDSGADRR